MRGVAVVLVLGLAVYSGVGFRIPKQRGSSESKKAAQVSLDFDEVGVVTESVSELNTSATDVIVKLMVIWTNAFECHVSGKGPNCRLTTTTKSNALKKINPSIQNVKTAFSNSKIGATIQVVYKKRMNFVESGTINDMNLMNRCEISNFCENRTQSGAHIAAAFTANGGLSGAARKGPDPRFRSATIGKNVPLWTLAHEIGHIFGARDDRATDESSDSCTSTKTWFGYRTPDFKYRDLMSMNCQVGTHDCSVGTTVTQACARMNFYGDPAITYEGRRTGSRKECSACQMRVALSTIVNKMPVKR